ncbi:ATP-grasp domain-containing protein [Pedobacter gandavensis]|uniref:Prokaryotic glutathione synthetase ATP-binding domain-containing protein n=1 Tax=Pedobacter gandavensis TaxID=2679963 RepID=A0ABR6F1F6_9SPHI|nr:hypothetical protein [Pedobacter gandavensis]MBB2151354.1 hypothetical protein [Pedobacter gandavensis]
MTKIAYVSYHIQEVYTPITEDEESTLLNFLLEKGLAIERVIWNDPLVDWEKYNLAILKSPWDYTDHLTDFKQWLDHLESLGIKLLNPFDKVRWNMDKHYLQEIADAGLPVIKSLYLEKGSVLNLSSLLAGFNVDQLIIKPCVSAGAKHTYVLREDNFADHQEQINDLLKENAFIVQPFMKEVFEGEWSFLFFNGNFSHCLLKVPKDGEFRVQHYYGGSVSVQETADKYIQEAKAYVDQFAKGCLYARVDGLLVNDQLNLMELELIEPYLFLNSHPGSLENYYQALTVQLNS